MAKARIAAKVQPRVVRSLHLSKETDARIVRGARLSGESIVGFIRAAASTRAAMLIEAKAAVDAAA